MDPIRSILSFLKYTLRRPVIRFLMIIGRHAGAFFDKKLYKNSVRNILVIQFGGIGDVIRIFPSIRILHREFPAASISVFTEFNEEIFDLFADKHLISEFIQLDSRKKQKSFFKKLAIFKNLRAKGFDLIYNPGYGYGMMEFSIISFVIGAPYRIGFTKDGAGFLNTTKRELLDNVPVIEQQMQLLCMAGIRCNSDDLVDYLGIREECMEYARQFYESHGLMSAGTVVTVHPSAKWETQGRCWPLNRYTELIGELVKLYDARIIIVGGKKDDWVVRDIREKIGENTINNHLLSTVGDTSIHESAAIIAMSDLFIGNDSGLLHIAIGLNVPAIGIFGFTSSKQVIPSNSSAIAIEKYLPCRPCYRCQPLFRFQCKDAICLDIPVADVMKSVNKLMETRRGIYENWN